MDPNNSHLIMKHVIRRTVTVKLPNKKFGFQSIEKPITTTHTLVLVNGEKQVYIRSCY